MGDRTLGSGHPHGKVGYALQSGDQVLVAFERGDPRIPYVLGTLWDSSDAPPD